MNQKETARIKELTDKVNKTPAEVEELRRLNEKQDAE